MCTRPIGLSVVTRFLTLNTSEIEICAANVASAEYELKAISSTVTSRTEEPCYLAIIRLCNTHDIALPYRPIITVRFSRAVELPF